MPLPGDKRVVPLHLLKAVPARSGDFRESTRVSGLLPHTMTVSFFRLNTWLLSCCRDGEKEGSHARAVNYLSLGGMEKDVVVLRDELTKSEYRLQPKLIINATGPWIDLANRTLGLDTQYIGPTKGSHLVLDNPRLRAAIGEHEFFFENSDGRIVLILPLFDKVMVGTTDLEIQHPDSARCTEPEVDYFIAMVARLFPDIPIDRRQIIYRFSGVRPLAHTHARNAGQITRDHHIQENRIGAIPVYSLVGGKWTSYRAFSEQVTDRVLAFLGQSRKAGTASIPIGAGADAAQLRTKPDYTREEIEAIARDGKIVHLDDLLLRRTLLAYLGQLTPSLVEEMSDWLGDILQWDQDRKKEEVDRLKIILADRHQLVL